ncbi:hypothetical protein TGAM01_v200327 [Trichoderma gamsii]|uniref:Uncharacterized protein n=1 Tax=Trichoderma gamsii TaxID=398673 RepID=A0A2P5A2X5_9HYPO|nr:hypothetical protein TGAM01_v200327 [Trichoderma gamsii]PON30906.1 hypothetical protein TGAM01_v200327 [Trichoderma gamsii]
MPSTHRSGSPTQQSSRSPASVTSHTSHASHTSHHSLLSRHSHSSHHSQQSQHSSQHSRSLRRRRRRRSRRSSQSAAAKPDSPRIVLGHGTIARLPTELNRLCLSRPLIIYSQSRLLLANRIRTLLPNFDAHINDSDTRPSSAMMFGRDSVISVGGPRAVEMARRVSSKMTIPHICIPTTHSGAAGGLSAWTDQQVAFDSPTSLEEEEEEQEDSDVCGNGKKKMLPAVIIYDERFTESHTKRISAPSGFFVDADSDVDENFEPGTGAVCNDATVDLTDNKASERRSANSSTAQWSYIHLPGV